MNTEIKPPYGYRLIDPEKDAPKRWDDLLRPYARTIDPGHGFRLLREDEIPPSETFDVFIVRDGEGCWYDFCGDEARYPTVASVLNDHPLVRAIRVPVPAAAPVITDPNTAHEQRIAHTIREWIGETGNMHYEKMIAHCARRHILAIEAQEARFTPKPISDLSGLPDEGPILIYADSKAHWVAGTAGNLRRGFTFGEFWMPMPPNPTPPAKTREGEQSEIVYRLHGNFLRDDEQNALEAIRLAVEAGIAFARKDKHD